MKTKELLFVLFGFYINMVTSDLRYFTQKMGVKSFARNEDKEGMRNHKKMDKKTNEKSSDEQVIGVLTIDISCVDVLDAHL